MANEFTLEEALAPPPKAAPKTAPKEFTLAEALAAPASSTAAQNLAEAQARQDVASQGSEQISTPQAELADAERNVAALRRELARKGADAGPRPAIGSTKAGDFLLAQGAKAQGQQPVPADAIAPPPAQTQLAPPAAPLASQLAPQLAPKPVVAGRFGAAGVGPAAARPVPPSQLSALEKAPNVVPAVSETQAALNMAGVSPVYVASLKAEYNQLEPAKRVVALQQALQANPPNTVKGRAIRAVVADDDAWKAATNQTPAARLLSPRLEDVAANIQARYPERPAELVLLDAQQAMARGQSNVDYGSAQALTKEQSDAMDAAAVAKANAEKSKKLSYADIGASNLAGGFADVALAGAQSVTDAFGATDKTKQLAATRKSVQSFIQEHGGDTTFGKVMSATGALTPAIIEGLAAPLTGGSSLIPLISSGILYGLPDFKETLAEQLKSGAPVDVALEHALAAGGMMVVGGRLVATGGKILPQGLKASDRLLPQMTAAAAEGTAFYAADKGLQKTISGMNQLAGRPDASEHPFSVEDMVTTALSMALARGAHVGVSNLQGKAAADARIPYAKDNSYTGLAKLIAEAKGFNFKPAEPALGKVTPAPVSTEPALGKPLAEAATTNRAEPELGKLENMQAGEEPPMAKAGKTAPVTEAAPAAEVAPSEKAIAEKLQAQGVPGPLARRMAKKQVEEQGAKDVAGTEPTTSGEGTSVAGESRVEPAAGPETSARDGVVPTTTDAGLAATGKALEPVALKEETKGKPSGTETVEAKQAEAQEQEASAAPVKARKTEPIIDEKGAFIPSGKKGENPIATAGFKVLDEDNNLSENLAGATLITGMDTTKEGQGTGSKLLKAITDWADANGKRLALVPAAAPKGELGLSQEQLKEWYARNGFEDRTDFMVRKPGGKKTEAPAAPKPETKVEAPTTNVTLYRGAPKGQRDTVGGALFKSPDKGVAETYAGKDGAVTEEVHSFENPLQAATWADAKQKLGLPQSATMSDLVAAARKAGHDVVTFKANGQFEYIVLGKKTEAPAVPKPSKAAKPGKEKHTVAQNTEGKWEHAINGEVASTYDTKRQAIAAELLNKAKKAGNAENIAQRQKAFDDAMAAEGRGRPLKPVEAGDKQELAELESALKAYDSPASNNDQIRASAGYIRDIANDPTAPPAVRKRAQQMLKEEVDPKDIPKSSSTLSIQASEGVKDTAFSTFTTSSQTLSHIVKTGTAFQKKLAQRLRNVVRDVKMVVIEKGQELPATLAAVKDKWDQCLALYSSEGDGVVYTKGESFGRANGLNKVVQSHELLHAAMSQKIRTALAYMSKGRHLDSQMVKAVEGLQKTMRAAAIELNKQIKAGTVDPHLYGLAHSGEAFSNLHEFVAYAMSDSKVQDFLKTVEGYEKNTQLFSPFVDSVRRMFGMGEKDINALSDLIQHTDQLLSSRRPGGWGYAEEGTHASAAIPPTPEEREAEIRRATEAVETGRIGKELGDATSNLASYRDPRLLWDEVKGLVESGDARLKSIISHAYDSEAIAYGGPGDVISGLKDAHEAIQKMSATEQVYLRRVAEISDNIVDFFRAEPGKRQTFEDVVNESTFDRYDPSDPPAGKSNPKLDEDYAALGEKGQKLYQDLRDHYKVLNEVKEHLLEENIAQLDVQPEDREKLLAAVRLLFEQDSISPYFPLARFGDHVLEVKLPGKPRASYRFESMRERNRAARGFARQQGRSLDELIQDGVIKRTVSDDENMRGNIEKTSQLLKGAFEAIDTAQMGTRYASDAAFKQSLKDGIYQAYLESMPEGGVRKLFIHRKGTPGFSSDILRTVNATGISMARALAKLEHGPAIRQALELSRRQMETNNNYAPFVTRMDEFASAALTPIPRTGFSKWLDSAAGTVIKVAFIKNLTAFRSAVLQPMDIGLKGIWILLGNHGLETIPEVLKMLKVWNQFGFTEKKPDGTTVWHAPSIEYAKGLTPLERQAVRDAVDIWGVTKSTQTDSIFSKSKKPNTKVGNKTLDIGHEVLDKLILGGMMHHGERLSREFQFMPSYRMWMRKFQKENPSQPGSTEEAANHTEAVDRAVREVNEALGNYSPDSRQMMLRGFGGKLLGLYKFFPYLTTKLLVGNFFKMLPLFNKEGKAAAATKFFGVLSSHVLFGGFVVVPGIALVSALLDDAWNWFTNQHDAPDSMKHKDRMVWFRTEFLPNVLGKTGLDVAAKKVGIEDPSRLMTYGAGNYITGMDISGAINLNDMWIRDPQPGKDIPSTMANWGQVLAGPVANLGLDAARAVQLWSQGEYERGFEKIAPAAMSKLMTEERYRKEGIQTPAGAQLAMPGTVPTNELIGQAIGFAPAQIAQSQDTAIKTNAAVKAINDEHKRIVDSLGDYNRKSMDPTLPQEKRERFHEKFVEELERAFMFSVNNPEYQIRDHEIQNALNLNQKRAVEATIGGGIVVNKKNYATTTTASEYSRNALKGYNPKGPVVEPSKPKEFTLEEAQ